MKKEWVLSVGMVALTLAIALGMIRWFAPQLLGIPVDLQAVRVSKEVPPFYENVFRKEDINSKDFLLKDPYTNVRAKPLFVDLAGFGPHDLLGFRNRNIPDIADVVAIGDSQTYGNNTVLAKNWPSQLETRLQGRRATLYSMATGGWGAIQYLNMFSYATAFRPRVVVVAFYTGNDPDESVTLAYSVDRWAPLRPDHGLDLSDKPRYPGFPVPPSEQWPVQFKDDVGTIFVPSLRLISNDTSYATVRAGYQIMEKVAELMAKTAADVNIKLVLTILPTKELVYANRVANEGMKAVADYTKLVELERANIDRLSRAFKSLPNVEYVDMMTALQKAASSSLMLYAPDTDGHPMEAGNQVIAETLAPVISRYLTEPLSGPVRVAIDSKSLLFLVTPDGLWQFSSLEIAEKNGWKSRQVRIVDSRDIAAIPLQGTIKVVDPKKFGPQALRARVVVR